MCFFVDILFVNIDWPKNKNIYKIVAYNNNSNTQQNKNQNKKKYVIKLGFGNNLMSAQSQII